MAWFKREKKRIDQPTPPDERRVKTEGLWTKCESCRAIVWKKDLEANWRVCPKCQHHFRLNATQRLVLLLDSRWVEHDASLGSNDPLHFTDTKLYASRLKDARKKLGMADAIVTAEGLLGGRPVICCSMEFNFIGGSMGAVVGEKVTRAIEAAIAKRVPLVIISCSGGARMMEGTISLMQLAKVSAAPPRCRRASPCRLFPSSPIPRPAATPRAMPCSATSTSPSPARSSVSPGRASSNRPSAKNFPKAFRRRNFFSSTVFSTPSFIART